MHLLSRHSLCLRALDSYHMYLILFTIEAEYESTGQSSKVQQFRYRTAVTVTPWFEAVRPSRDRSALTPSLGTYVLLHRRNDTGDSCLFASSYPFAPF
jgi:hypothetical protein